MDAKCCVQYMLGDRSLWEELTNHSGSTDLSRSIRPTHVLLNLVVKCCLKIKTWRSPSSTSKHCFTASRTDKDDEVLNEGEDNGRMGMQ